MWGGGKSLFITIGVSPKTGRLAIFGGFPRLVFPVLGKAWFHHGQFFWPGWWKRLGSGAKGPGKFMDPPGEGQRSQDYRWEDGVRASKVTQGFNSGNGLWLTGAFKNKAWREENFLGSGIGKFFRGRIIGSHPVRKWVPAGKIKGAGFYPAWGGQRFNLSHVGSLVGGRPP